MSTPAAMNDFSNLKWDPVTTIEEKLHLITRNLDEVMGGEVCVAKIRTILEKRDLKIYWGTATTGAPHIAYFVPISKIADFLRAGCEVTILFADLHAYLDNLKSTWEVLQYRTQYYEHIIKGMLRAIGVPLDKLKFVRGTTYQLQQDYTLDMYKLSTLTTERNSKKAGSEVVKQVTNALLSGMLYPLLQSLDEHYLGVDAQFGGTDQRKIFAYAEKYLPGIGYNKRIHLMNPMVPGLTGNKMSSSDTSSKIDVLDSPESIQTKIKGAFCDEGNVENNGVLSFIRMVLFPLCIHGFTIERKEENGGIITYGTYEDLHTAFAAKQLYPGDLKAAVTKALISLLQPIRTTFQDPVLQELVNLAYPPENKTKLRQEEEHKLADSDDDNDNDDVDDENKTAIVTSVPTAKNKCTKPAVDVSKLDIKVGRIISAKKHPNVDKLYIAEIDIGEETGPRQVVSGLTHLVPLEELPNRMVCVLTNTKPASFKGEKSTAMILSASNTIVELLSPPEAAKIGERITFTGFHVPAEIKELTRATEPILKAILPDLMINTDGVATYKGTVPFTTTAGVVTVKSLKNVKIK